MWQHDNRACRGTLDNSEEFCAPGVGAALAQDLLPLARMTAPWLQERRAARLLSTFSLDLGSPGSLPSVGFGTPPSFALGFSVSY